MKKILKLKFVEKFLQDFHETTLIGKFTMMGLSFIAVLGFTKLAWENPYMLFVILPTWLLYEIYG